MDACGTVAECMSRARTGAGDASRSAVAKDGRVATPRILTTVLGGLRIGSLPRTSVDVATVAAIGAAAYIAVTVAHEGFGHGLACLAVGGTPSAMSSTELRCDGPSGTPALVVTAAGSVANLVFGVMVLGWTVLRLPRSGTALYLAWVLSSLNLYHAGSYLLIGGLFGFGDWGRVAVGVLPGLGGQILVALVGLGVVLSANRTAAHPLWQPLVGIGDERASRWQLMTWPALATALLVSLGAGLLSPLQPQYALVTSAVAPLTYLWLVRLPRWPSRAEPAPPLRIGPSLAWLVVGIVAAITFMVAFGPGVGSFAGYSIAR
jgi:hypothetical protein